MSIDICRHCLLQDTVDVKLTFAEHFPEHFPHKTFFILKVKLFTSAFARSGFFLFIKDLDYAEQMNNRNNF